MSSDFSYGANWFRLALLLAIVLHAGVMAILAGLPAGASEPQFKPLAVMDFAHYDPEGGSPGGGKGDEPSTGPEPGEGPPAPPGPSDTELIETSTVEPPLVPEKPEDEPVEPPEIITSASEEAAPMPPPPPKAAEVKPKIKPKAAPKKSQTKAKKSTVAANKPAQGGGGGGAAMGEVKPGGGLGSGRGGIGGGSGQGNPNALKAYLAKLRQKLERNKKYPPTAESKKVGGVVTVNFTVNRSGAVTSARLAGSSGNADLDREVMALVRRVSPFPPMPKELTQSSLSVTVPIQFKPRR